MSMVLGVQLALRSASIGSIRSKIQKLDNFLDLREFGDFFFGLLEIVPVRLIDVPAAHAMDHMAVPLIIYPL